MSATTYTIAPDVLGSHLDGEAILLHIRAQSYCRLNATAAAVWRGIEEGLDRGGIVAALCRTYEVDEPRAAAAVDAVVDDLVRRELLESPGALTAVPSTGRRAPAAPDAARVHLLSHGDFQLEAAPDTVALVSRWLPRVPTAGAAGDAVGPRLRLRVRTVPGTTAPPAPDHAPGFTIGDVAGWVDGATGRTTLRAAGGRCGAEVDQGAAVGTVAVAGDAGTATVAQVEHDAHSVLAVASALLLLRLDGYLTHAGGVVAPDGRAWLLVGDSHSGKTTTCLNLIGAGWDYLSDDNTILFVDAARGTVLVEGWPRLFHLDAGWTAGTPEGRRVSFDPRGAGPGRWRRTAPLGGLLFPAVDAAGATRAHRLAPVDALAGLIRQSPWVLTDPRRGAERLAALSLVARRPAFGLRLGLDSYRDAQRVLRALSAVAGADGPLGASEAA